MAPISHDEGEKVLEGGEKSPTQFDEKFHQDALSDVSHEHIEHTLPSDENETGTSLPKDAEDTYPEGGLRAWLVVIGSWCGLFCALGLLNSLATFQAHLVTHQLADENEGKIGWILSVHTFLAFFCGIYVGPIFDKHGPRWLVLAGSLFLCSGLLCLSFSMSTLCLWSNDI
jgi:hypothetical protein